MEITKKQYDYALARVEELLPTVQDTTPANDRNALELSIVADMVRDYEMQYHPIEKPTVGELISLSIEERGMTQKQLAAELGVSPSRVNDFISGRSEPSLRIAHDLCSILDIAPAAMLGF